MTDMEIKYQTLKEAERANRAQEELKRFDIASQVPVRESQAALNKQGINKLAVEIANIAADTSLTPYKREQLIAQATANYSKSFESATKGVSNIVDSAVKLVSFI